MSDSSAPDLRDWPSAKFSLAPAGVEPPTLKPIPPAPVSRIPGTNSEHPVTGKTITKPGSITP